MVGKRVHDTLYVHLSAIEQLGEGTRVEVIRQAIDIVGQIGEVTPNVAKINVRTGSFSLLAYPAFEEEAFPTLLASWRFSNEAPAKPTFRSYEDSLNPPILHRKERLVLDSHPNREEWAQVTLAAEQLGLFDDTLAIGFRLNWERLIAAKGYELIGSEFHPLGNDVSTDFQPVLESADTIRRHATALNRNTLSAPVQLLLRHGLLLSGIDFFDYGCGRGDDLKGLRALGFEANGWDPHYAPEANKDAADVVNLGFVINVIEDAAERIEALQGAFRLARRVLSIGVMLHSSDIGGHPYRDGYITSRNTFQKYFTQAEVKDFIEVVLHREAFMVAPGIAFVFADNNAEQNFLAGRCRRRNIAERLLSAQATRARIRKQETARPGRDAPSIEHSKKRLTKAEQQRAAMLPHLERLWALTLDLGRAPEMSEVIDLQSLLDATGSYARGLRLMREFFDQNLLHDAARARSDDLRLYFAVTQFEQRKPYRCLESRLQYDVKAFFGDYGKAQSAGMQLLLSAADPAVILVACQEARNNGIGWLDGEHSLQLHVSLIERLPVVLRAYVACAMVIWKATREVQLIKIHVASGKLTLLEFDDFDISPLPLLRRRLKINIRKQAYEEFEYGSLEFPKPHLFNKSRFLNEDHFGYGDQLEFDEAFEATGIVERGDKSGSRRDLAAALQKRRLQISGMRLIRSVDLPDLNQSCGENFTFRDFVECGDTQKSTLICNVPRNPETYNALYDLASIVLDPVVAYFGAIRLTYGFCSPELNRHIAGRVAPRLDQHASHEKNSRGVPICARGGAACDFIIDDENMDEVVDWIIENVSFDRIYYYGKKRPIHVSWAPACVSEVYSMVLSPSGRLIPRRYERR